MKTKQFFFLAAFLSISLFFTQCKKDEPIEPIKLNVVPTTFKVDIPESISSKNSTKSMNSDTLQGNQIYQHLRNFINIGEGSADIIEKIMQAISNYNINKAMSLSYQSDEDSRMKNLEVFENVTFDGKSWDFQLDITDALSEANVDSGYGLQVFWKTNPVVGIAIMKPYNIDRDKNLNAPDAMFKIEYSEDGSLGYDSHMIVSIFGLPLQDPLTNKYSVDNIKMFAGKIGENVDVYGNSNHPNATFFTSETGFDWAFVASGNNQSNVGVAEVGLPSNTLNSTDRNVILKTNSIKQVFTNQINLVWPGISANVVASYLKNTDAPGFFSSTGFVAAGTAPNATYNTNLQRIDNLTPYNPADIKALTFSFKLN